MAWKKQFICKHCGYIVDVYEGNGFFNQHITSIVCNDCNTIQNIVVGGVIGDIAPSFNSEVGRLCPSCGSDNIVKWDKCTCPKCGKKMEYSGEKSFWE